MTWNEMELVVWFLCHGGCQGPNYNSERNRPNPILSKNTASENPLPSYPSCFLITIAIWGSHVFPEIQGVLLIRNPPKSVQQFPSPSGGLVHIYIYTTYIYIHNIYIYTQHIYIYTTYI